MPTRSAGRGSAAARSIRLALRSLSTVATKSASLPRRVLRWRGSRRRNSASIPAAITPIPLIAPPSSAHRRAASTTFLLEPQPKLMDGKVKNPRALAREARACYALSMKRSEPVTTTEIAYNVLFEPDEEAGGYVVTGPALPGLVTEGDTLEEARAMAVDAIRVYLESLRDDGLAWPPSDVPRDEPIRAPVAVSLETV